MFGSNYAVMDQRLARGEIDRAQYAGELLAAFLGRARVFGALMDDSNNDDGQSAEKVIFQVVETFRRDVEEVCARGARAGLYPSDDSCSVIHEVSGKSVEEVGGLLVREVTQ